MRKVSQWGDVALGKVERATAVLNTFNRFQEFAIRRAVFATQLQRRLGTRGLSLEDVLEQGQFAKITTKELDESVSAALEMTWAKEFSSHEAPLPELMAGKFISLMENFGINDLTRTGKIALPRVD